jgi:hypothetical protein
MTSQVEDLYAQSTHENEIYVGKMHTTVQAFFTVLEDILDRYLIINNV